MEKVNIKPKLTPEIKAALEAQKNAPIPPDLVKFLNKPKRRKCSWPWDHDWTVWKTIEEGKIQRKRMWLSSEVTPPLNIGNYKVQERTCIYCGKLEIETLQTTIDN